MVFSWQLGQKDLHVCQKKTFSSGNEEHTLTKEKKPDRTGWSPISAMPSRFCVQSPFVVASALLRKISQYLHDCFQWLNQHDEIDRSWAMFTTETKTEMVLKLEWFVCVIVLLCADKECFDNHQKNPVAPRVIRKVVCNQATRLQDVVGSPCHHCHCTWPFFHSEWSWKVP